MKAITPHYIDGKFVEPHGREVMDMYAMNPTPSQELHSREARAPVFADLNK